MEHLGSPDYKTIRNDLVFSTNCCHGGEKFKLHYHHDSKYFHCYTDCGCNYSLFELIQKNKDLEFVDALYWLADFVGKYPECSNVKKEPLIQDWLWLNKYKKHKNKSEVILNIYDKSVLDRFYKYPHIDLLNEGISCETQNQFDIRYDLQSNRIIIPAYTKDNQLLGCKGRIIKELEDEDNRYIGIIPYNKSHVLWGLQNTYPYILEHDKLILFESEKSTMKAWEFDVKFSCAIGGQDVSSEQVRQSISLASEIILALDEGVSAEKYKKIIKAFKPYVKLSIIYSKELGEKNAPVDQGREFFMKLYEKRHRIN